MTTTKRRHQGTINEVARLELNIRDIKAKIDAGIAAYNANGSLPSAQVEQINAWDAELSELLDEYQDAKAEQRQRSEDPVKAMFRGESIPTGDGSRRRSLTGTGELSAAILDGAGWDLRSRPSVELPIADAFPGIQEMASTLPSAETYSPRRIEAIRQLGMDTRWLWPWLNPQDIGDDTSIDDWRQSSTRDVTGTVERATDATTDKAELDVTVTAVNTEVKQLAIVIEDIPNQLLTSLSSARAFFESELRYQINLALDAHVLAQIAAASPPSGQVGINTFEYVRNGIAAMRLLGAEPDLLTMNPTDAATLDLLQDNNATYFFSGPSRGDASRVWNLQKIEVSTPAGTDPPMLIDRQLIGLLYTGTMRLEADPYTSFKKNLTNLRLEMNALMHVRDANGAYTIE